MATITAGTKIPCRVSRTLDVGDFSLLHQLTWFNMAIHSNSEYAKGTWFKERSLAGPVIFSVADGLVHQADNVAELLAQDGYQIYAYLGVEKLKLTAPVLFGDTLRADAEVVALRATKHSERFLLIYQNKTYNQRNQQVIEYQTTMMVTKKT
ncbi:MAG: MaoC/PaaZ C-terminal domain-containing protein [Candidatus Competibacter denitrificans]|jgi:acyl dehydratase|uniref:MaoC-like dehydratase n=1 Tax=Candidatus Competibacter denitrificans Run_A_D11 TaxID=1400863 RepID=W6M468_9GAMM|nr:MaoC/PaaZ C-terminal domain-containing protein [Candidatus Competibacter denitrificans]CDI01359.1 MaoC-like dehydratase [Candidatus Competibacter denitrificans Run_A_D11]HRC69198.1 MaoC/PaaZ C-terminal domain-containing protein [Candidatus Competibacter denitrificans]